MPEAFSQASVMESLETGRPPRVMTRLMLGLVARCASPKDLNLDSLPSPDSICSLDASPDSRRLDAPSDTTLSSEQTSLLLSISRLKLKSSYSSDVWGLRWTTKLLWCGFKHFSEGAMVVPSLEIGTVWDLTSELIFFQAKNLNRRRIIRSEEYARSTVTMKESRAGLLLLLRGPRLPLGAEPLAPLGYSRG